MNPRVSICTSVLNMHDYLRRCIESVRAQTFQEWEHIIVDDGSTDDIKALVESFNDPRLVYVRFPENKGFQAGYNHALTLATGDYVGLLAADEFIWERKLEVQVAWMDEHPTIGCTWGLPTPNIGQKWELGGPRPSWEQYQARAHNRSRQAWIRTLLFFENIPIGGASMLMRRECQKEIGGFDSRLNACSDLELFVRFFQKYEGHVLPYRLADADHPEGSMSRKPDAAERFQADVKILREKHKIELPPPTGRVTVGIPVYNMAKYIGRALQSLKEQTEQNFDIIVLDDASTDQEELMQALAPYAEDIHLVRMEENAGIQMAVNAMLALCETEFFVSLAADDWLEPTFIERCLAEFRADPFLEYVATQTDFYDAAGNPLPPRSNAVQNIPPARNRSREQWLETLYHGNHYFGVGMFRANALREIGGFKKDDGVLCDYDVYLRLLQRENIKIIEEPITHTRIHDGNKSVGPGKFTQQWLREKYHEIRTRYFAPRPKVIIATPFYELRGFSPYISSLAQTCQALTTYGIAYEFWELSGDSYVDRAKNTLFTKFLEDPAATDLFMIDSDMRWDVAGFISMLMLPEEIVQASYPQKNQWDKFTAIPKFQETEPGSGKWHPIGRNLNDGTALLLAEYLAGGFIRIKRSALEKYRDAYPKLRYKDMGADPTTPDRTYINFFNCEIREHPLEDGTTVNLRWGEDRIFGLRMKEIGIESWIYPNVNTGHFGVKGWEGNYHDHLSRGAQAGVH